MPVLAGSVPTANVCAVCGPEHGTGAHVAARSLRLLGREPVAGAELRRCRPVRSGLASQWRRAAGGGQEHQHHREGADQHRAGSPGLGSKQGRPPFGAQAVNNAAMVPPCCRPVSDAARRTDRGRSSPTKRGKPGRWSLEPRLNRQQRAGSALRSCWATGDDELSEEQRMKGTILNGQVALRDWSGMDLIETEFSDPIAEVRLLRRQVQRERARRQAAESLGERVTRDLYESVRQLRSAQSELLERADRSRVVNDLARSLRHDHDTGRLLHRAAEAVGRTISVDRAAVLLVDPQPGTTGAGSWTSEAQRRASPVAGVRRAARAAAHAAGRGEREPGARRDRGHHRRPPLRRRGRGEGRAGSSACAP